MFNRQAVNTLCKIEDNYEVNNLLQDVNR
jgi:hypothetical protein